MAPKRHASRVANFFVSGVSFKNGKLVSRENIFFKQSQFTLSGFTHSRGYAGGYLRNTPGWAKVKVSNLKPNTRYQIATSQFCNLHCSNSKIKIPGNCEVIPKEAINNNRSE